MTNEEFCINNDEFCSHNSGSVEKSPLQCDFQGISDVLLAGIVITAGEPRRGYLEPERSAAPPGE